MSLIASIAIYGIIWWVVLFAVLPFGVRRPEEAGEEPVFGADASAPAQPRILRILLMTTLVAAAIWAVVFVVFEFRLITLDDVPFFPRFERDWE